MAFRFSFRVDPNAITVPYAPITDDSRQNRGFVDLRGHPNKARDIAEGIQSSALQRLLVRIAAVGSPIFTLGCDTGVHSESTRTPLRRREVASGYIQFASSLYYLARLESYAAFANAIVADVKQDVEKNYWEIRFVGQMVNFRFEDAPMGIYPSLMTWFYAAAANPIAARESRERLIEAIDKATAKPATLESFVSVPR
jgi:hypothetical protein